MVIFGPLAAVIDWRVWGTQAYFRGYGVLATALNGSQPNFSQCLAVFWLLHYIYIFEILSGPKCVQVLRFPIFAALLHGIGSGTVGVIQTLRHDTRNNIMELSLHVIFNRGRHLYFPIAAITLCMGPHSFDGDPATLTERITAPPLFGPLCSGTVAHLSNC